MQRWRSPRWRLIRLAPQSLDFRLGPAALALRFGITTGQNVFEIVPITSYRSGARLHGETAVHEPPHWPAVIGMLGIVVGAILLLDTVDDLFTLQWTAEDWRGIFAPQVADMIARSMPSSAWRVVSAAVEIGLAALLIIGSLGLRRRARHGVSLCRLWAWLALVWLAVVFGRGALWLWRHADELPALGGVTWQAYVPLAVVMAMALLAAFPLFLLVWLSRPAVRADYRTWSR